LSSLKPHIAAGSRTERQQVFVSVVAHIHADVHGGGSDSVVNLVQGFMLEGTHRPAQRREPVSALSGTDNQSAEKSVDALMNMVSVELAKLEHTLWASLTSRRSATSPVVWVALDR
jgi:hypothetical protein